MCIRIPVVASPDERGAILPGIPNSGNPKIGRGRGSTAGPVFSQLMGFTLHRYGVAPSGREATVLPVTW